MHADSYILIARQGDLLESYRAFETFYYTAEFVISDLARTKKKR